MCVVTVVIEVHSKMEISRDQGMGVLFPLTCQPLSTFVGLHRSHVLSVSVRKMKFWIKKQLSLKGPFHTIHLLHNWFKFYKDVNHQISFLLLYSVLLQEQIIFKFIIHFS